MKIFYGIAFIVFAAAEVFIVIKLKSRKQNVGFKATLVSFGLIFVLTLFVCLLGLDISHFILLLAAVAILFDSFIGYYLGYYSKSRIVDRYIHGYGTFAFSLLVYNVIILVTEEGGSTLFRALFVFSLGVALGALHEIMEFLTDSKRESTRQTQMQKGLRDTNVDIIFNVIGAAVAAAVAYFFMM